MADVLIQRCDEDTDAWRAVVAHALVAMFGKQQVCSAQNVRDSCFGAEWCDREGTTRAPLTFVTDLMTRSTCYAALDPENLTFRGIVAIREGGEGEEDAEEDAGEPKNTLHAFCVDRDARRGGVGRRLMTEALCCHGRHRPMVLTVADATSHGPAAEVLRERHERLVPYYESWGFRTTGRTADGYTVMERPPGAPQIPPAAASLGVRNGDHGRGAAPAA